MKHYKPSHYISKKQLDKLGVSEKDRSDYFKYRRLIRDEIPKKKLEIEYLKDDIREIQKKIGKYNRIVNELYGRINYIFEDYTPNIYIVKNGKKSTSKKKDEINYFWMVNVKYKRKTKPIYLGSDKKVRKIICGIHNKRINLKEEKLKDLIKYEIYDNIWDWVIEEKDNIFNLKVNLESFLDS